MAVQKLHNLTTTKKIDSFIKKYLTILSNLTIMSNMTVVSEWNEFMEASCTEMAQQKQSRQRRSYGKTRKKILTAARSVFTEKGLSAGTIDEIAERGDVARGSFYYHFDNKDDLIRHMIEGLLVELVAEIDRTCASQTEIESVLDSMIGAHINFFSSRWKDFVLYYQGRADLTLNESFEGLETPFLVYLNAIEAHVVRVIAQPVSKNRLRRLACAIAGFISGYYSFASVTCEEDNVDESFMSLRNAFVGSLVRFIKEALPQT